MKHVSKFWSFNRLQNKIKENKELDYFQDDTDELMSGWFH